MNWLKTGILITFVGMAACSADSIDLYMLDLAEDEIQLRYDETQCADPWYGFYQEVDVLGSREEKINQLLGYMQHNGIDVLAVSYEFDEENVIACLECQCLTGGIYFIKVKDQTEQVQSLIKMGFRLI